ncbi:PrpF domain-containing protein [Pseudomonas oryzihabitans]|uniref:PrpF domain-containing protein n=1 Tax=Pseudomonas oryzihabitans TaxID=47885 RepID=UPI00285D78B5|nr:PrpF domain-containing protein [Pseudomonas psychrotolerans]MDR6680689.1 2-methylaconitate cis-trans-isomerase PrpF [Pseudomonas psychrotolerans]
MHAKPSPLASPIPELPVHYMRGGTSTGVVIWEPLVPQQEHLRAELLRHLMGVPHTGEAPGNRQITGLGRGPATSNKVFLAHIEETTAGQRIVSTLAQLANEHGEIDWSVNCGNMSSALPLWAVDSGLIEAPESGAFDIEIRNTNTGVLTVSRMARETDGRFVVTEIPGVMGAFPQVDLFLQSPVGSKTGALLPTGAVVDEIKGVAVSCVDVAVPMVIVAAASLGKTAQEPIAELEADAAFMARLRQLWIEAGLRMQLRRRDGELLTREELARSETIPKVCIVGAPRHGGHLAVRYFTPQTGHDSMAVSGGCCLAAACLLPGSTAFQVAADVPAPTQTYTDIPVSLENPAGLLDTLVTARHGDAGLDIQAAAYRRSAQILMRGQVPLYGASAELIQALADLA